jgi:hypothetical protein
MVIAETSAETARDNGVSVEAAYPADQGKARRVPGFELPNAVIRFIALF